MAKTDLSIAINKLPPTSTSEENDYIIIESTTQGTRIIKRKDLIPELDVKFGAGLKVADDNTTIQVDFENVAGNGLSGSDETQRIDVVLGDNMKLVDNEVTVDEDVAFSTSSPSSMYYYDVNGDRQINSNTPSGVVYQNYWGKGGSLSSIQLTPYTVPTINDTDNIILFNLADASIPNQCIIQSTWGGLMVLPPVDNQVTHSPGNSIFVNDSIVRWDSQPRYRSNAFSTVGITHAPLASNRIQTRIKFSSGVYFFNGGFFRSYLWTFANAKLIMYDENDVARTVIASSSEQNAGWDKYFNLPLANVTPSGIFSITQDQVNSGWYMQLHVDGDHSTQQFFNSVGYTDVTTVYKLSSSVFAELKFLKLG